MTENGQIYHCRKCGISYEPTPHQIRKADFLCPVCKKQYEFEYRAKRKAAGSPVVSGKMSREYHREYEKKYFLLETNRTRRAATQRKRTRDPANFERVSARYAVREATRRGELAKERCSVCGNPKAQAHHPDYSKPLDIVWLCLDHHREVHAAERKAKAKGQGGE